MPSLLGRATREIYRRELLPARARWWLAAAGMRDWYRTLGSELRPHLGDRARPLLADLGARMFERRYLKPIPLRRSVTGSVTNG